MLNLSVHIDHRLEPKEPASSVTSEAGNKPSSFHCQQENNTNQFYQREKKTYTPLKS